MWLGLLSALVGSQFCCLVCLLLVFHLPQMLLAKLVLEPHYRYCCCRLARVKLQIVALSFPNLANCSSRAMLYPTISLVFFKWYKQAENIKPQIFLSEVKLVLWVLASSPPGGLKTFAGSLRSSFPSSPARRRWCRMCPPGTQPRTARRCRCHWSDW